MGALEALRAALKLAKASGELRAAQEAAAKVATSKFANYTGELPVYHGSPHVWDEPSFLDHLKTGEGPLAYGPGGYVTGHRPLAVRYANDLAAEKSQGGQQRNAAAWIQGLNQEDPKTLARIFQLRTQYSVDRDTGFLSPTQRVDPGQFESWSDVANSTDLAKLVRRYPRVTSGVLPELRATALQHADAIRPFEQNMAVQKGRFQPPAGDYENPDRTDDIRRRNFASSTDFLSTGAPRSLTTSLTSHTHLGKPVPPPLDPQVYEMGLGARVEDMIPQDYPLATASPNTVGALEWLRRNLEVKGASGLSVQDTGRDWMSRLGLLRPDDARAAAYLMGDAGIPAAYYLRGGRRGAEGVPEVFDPEDYNFVTFDDNLLNLKGRYNKAKGGGV